MAFNIQCPYCGSLLEVLEQWIGTECGCPECGRTFVVPAPTPPPGVQPRPAYRQSPPPYEPPPRPYGGSPYKPNTGNTAKGEGENIPCLILGYAGIITPLLGIPVNIIGLILGIRRKYTVGIILNIVGLCIALFLTGIFTWSWLTAGGTGKDTSLINGGGYEENADKKLSVSPASKEHPDSKVPMTVYLEAFSGGLGYKYKFASEYKLYVDGQCVGTETTNDGFCTFKTTIKRGAEITGEIHEKNAFGAVVKVRKGILFDEDKEKAYQEKFVTIKCF